MRDVHADNKSLFQNVEENLTADNGALEYSNRQVNILEIVLMSSCIMLFSLFVLLKIV